MCHAYSIVSVNARVERDSTTLPETDAGTGCDRLEAPSYVSLKRLSAVFSITPGATDALESFEC